MSSSLPARDGALESSNGDAKGLPMPCSDAQLDLLEDIDEPGREAPGLAAGESLYRRGARADREGGSSISEDSATPAEPLYKGREPCGNRFLDCNPGVPGTLIVPSDDIVSSKLPPLPEFTVM